MLIHESDPINTLAEWSYTEVQTTTKSLWLAFSHCPISNRIIHIDLYRYL